ncbi:MAG: hypothetical protein IJG18_10345 [Kiritimatiellae bacterium]|nr:hypothetical protein [Kiritimatiellia bacterium]
MSTRTSKLLGAAAVSVGAMLPLSAMADAVRVYDADDYVQDGLILHFDGIRNAGATEAHSTDATAWANLGSLGSSCDATKTVAGQCPDGSADGAWESLGYAFAGKEYFTIGAQVTLGETSTTQIRADYDHSNAKSSYPALFGAITLDKDTFVIYGAKKYSSINFKQNNANAIQENPWESNYITAAFDAANGRSSLTSGVEHAWQAKSLATIYSGNPLDFAIGTAQNSDAARSARILYGTVHSVRVYDRVLENSELEWNRMVDESRFGGTYGGTGNDVANVIVATDTEGFEGTEACGKWLVSSAHEFSAPQRRLGTDGAYECDGYTIETWNDSAWGEAVRHSGLTYTASGAAKVRLTWKWTKTGNVATLGNYDVDDYVQDGLILHFDGIRNAGAAVAHDSDATTWVNLVSGQPSATFIRSNAAYGAWRDDGFYFEGKDRLCGAWLDEAVSLGPNMTIQVATTVDPLAQASYNTNKQYPAYFYGPSPDFGIYQGAYSGADKVPRQLTCKSSATYSANNCNTTIAEWDGLYASMILGDDMAYLTQTANYDNGKERTPGSAASQRYSWGCGVDASGNCVATRAVVGTFHSVRVYARALDEDELAQNRAVDDARFRANVTIVNGAIGETGETGRSDAATGAYSLESGTWTITAEKVKVENDGIYMPKLLVETYDEETGKWVANTPRPVWAESYTIDKTTLGGSRIRLTWTWGKRIGLIISFH